MTNKSYEAAVKLSTGEVVVYHNINTGLFKFHRFIEDKFSHFVRIMIFALGTKVQNFFYNDKK